MKQYLKLLTVKKLCNRYICFVCSFISILYIITLNSNVFSQEIKVMTYNIYHGEQHYDPGKSSLTLIAEVINKYKPDLVALQEIDSMTRRSAGLNSDIPIDLVLELSRLTGMKGFFGKAIDFSNGAYGNGILTSFPAKSSNYSLPSPMGGERRVLLLINAILPNKQEVVFASTHLCHQYPENNLSQAKTIREIFKNERYPVIIGGDFNFSPESDGYKEITKDFKDAAKLIGDPRFTHSSKNPRSRIDYIFLSPDNDWIIKNVEIIPVTASDHMPVLVTLELKKD